MQDLCYELTIEHDSKHTDDRHYLKSKAEKTICLEKPLLEDPGDYNVSIDNFFHQYRGDSSCNSRDKQQAA